MLCLLICASLVSGVHCKCMSYKKLVNSLKDDFGNTERLVQAFFPTDKPISSVVSVTYIINLSTVNDSMTPTVPAPKHVPTLHRVLRESKELIALSDSSDEPNSSNARIPETPLSNLSPNLMFRWTATPIPLIIQAELLEILSLFAFRTEVAQVDLNIEVDPHCTIPTELNSKSCEDKSGIVALLSELTSNVSLLACNHITCIVDCVSCS